MQLIIKNGFVPQHNGILQKGHIGIEKGIIKQIWFNETPPDFQGIEVIDAEGFIISPGFIDTHNHGGSGFGYNCDLNEWKNIEQRLSSAGVTSILATWESSPLDEMLNFFEKIQVIEKNNDTNNVEILGLHLEGPYFNKKMKGMHQDEFIRLADKEEIKIIIEKSNNLIKVWSLAPEYKENMDVIEELAKAGVSVSIAHTEAGYNTALTAFSLGANRVTHAFNAMPALHQRYQGLISAAWQYGAFLELIADNHHISPTIMKMLVSATDTGKIVLVSDNNECSGLSEGIYTVHKRRLIVANGRLENEGGGLAGSIVGLNQCALNITRLGFCTWTALKMASENPARSIGVFARKGSITIGKDADIVILDGQFNVIFTIKAGRVVYKRRQQAA